MADSEPKLGQTIRTNEGRQGIIRYVGGLHIAPGDWLGLELPDASGKNDGSVKGERYFTCAPGYGIFIRSGAVVEVLKQPSTKPTPKANGSVTASNGITRTRPSSGMTADVARKRQSLMSNGSGSATGSRLSVRSPTKSPTKPTNAISSPTTSIPRSRTPSMATKGPDPKSKSRMSISGRTSLGLSSSNTRPSAHTSRPSTGSASDVRSAVSSRPNVAPARLGGPGARLSQSTRSTLTKETSASKALAKVDHEDQGRDVRTPKIDEEAEESGEEKQIPNLEEALHQKTEHKDEQVAESAESDGEGAAQAQVVHPKPTKLVSASRTGTIGNVESRTAQQREIEQLKAKIRTLEKKRQEDRDKLQQVESLQNDKNRFEGIIQALQKKLRANQQELIEARGKYEEAEARANAVPERSGELESEMELATLDKEMAEERAEAFQMELEALKARHEELELEVEILREENAELASSMSPEEKASAGWLQMERERERLRDALLRLRDMSQENESALKTEIDELRQSLDEAEQTAGMYVATAERLSNAEATNKHLMGQLEAADSNDEVVEAMEIQREQHLHSIEQLRNQIQDLEEHIQVTDELENFHVDEEKRLHAQIDETEALLNESYRRSLDQDRVIEDLEYTLTKFRDVVQGLQSDIDELRRSRDISELQASEMSSKSRAMMDLNLRLQNTAAKTQTKIIETELNKVNAELANKHVDILRLFTPEIFEAEKKPILAFLCFSRTKSKANLVGKLLGDRLRERSHLSSGEEIFRTFEAMESMDWISAACERFERYMGTCGTQDFAGFGTAIAELEPIERTVTMWVEALRRDELANNEPEHLQRMQEILVDLLDKMVHDSSETKATEILTQMTMVENYAESLASQFVALTKMVQSKLGAPNSEHEDSLVFDKKMDQLSTKARTIKYLSGKVVQQLNELRNSSLCMGETHWLLFEQAEQEAQSLTKQVRAVGFALVEELSQLESDTVFSYDLLPGTMASVLQLASPSDGDIGDDPFSTLSTRLTSLQHLVDDVQTKSADLHNTIEFESGPSPWAVRAQEIKDIKLIPPEIQDELNRLERRNGELGTKIAERERQMEEMGMRVEIAEKRFKESRERDNKEKAVQEELGRLKTEKISNEQTIAELRTELATTIQTAQSSQTELEALRSAAGGDGPATTAASVASAGPTSIGGKVDESIARQFELEANLLQAEITSLQAAVRFLREENKNLRIPISEVLINSARHSWLDAKITRRNPTTDEPTKAKLEREAIDVWSGLIDIARSVKPVRLASAQRSTATNNININTNKTAVKPRTTWQPTAQTTRYAVLKQREELERWEAWRIDLTNRSKVVLSGDRVLGIAKTRPKTSQIGALPKLDGSNLSRGRGVIADADAEADNNVLKGNLDTGAGSGGNGGVVDRVKIVEF